MLICFNVLHYPISEIRGPNIRYDRIRRSQKTVEPRTLKGALQPKLPEIEALTTVEARGSVAVQPHNTWGSFEYTHPSGEVEPNWPYNTLKTQLIAIKHGKHIAKTKHFHWRVACKKCFLPGARTCVPKLKASKQDGAISGSPARPSWRTELSIHGYPVIIIWLLKFMMMN